ncbi:protein kinase [Candidatus Woesearchaeota archaeon]|nr:protein kinase [Candidatus Woesearchaeota archaeon]
MAGDLESEALRRYLQSKKGGDAALKRLEQESQQNDISLKEAFEILYHGHSQKHKILAGMKKERDNIKMDAIPTIESTPKKNTDKEKIPKTQQDEEDSKNTAEPKPQNLEGRTKTVKPGQEPQTMPSEAVMPEESGMDLAAEFENEEEKMPDPLGSQFGKTNIIDRNKYTELKELGKGGMGRVILARHNTLEKEVAIKYLLNMNGMLRFEYEAKTTGQLDHPNILPVHDYEPTEARFVMKRVKGENLKEVIHKRKEKKDGYHKKYTRHELLRKFIKVCEGMAYAHSKGVIHRDLKPENIMIGEFGEVLVMDWGLAKTKEMPEVINRSIAPSKNPDQTLEGTVMGTPMYMPPEQANGEIDKIDNKSDIYSLGATLFSLLSKNPDPISGTDVKNILVNVLRGKINKPKEVPAELCSIIYKAMEYKQEDRYPKVEGLGADVQAWLDGELVSEHPYTFFDKLKRKIKKHSGKIAAAALISASIAATGITGTLAFKAQADKEKAQAQTMKAKAEAEEAKAEVAVKEKEKIELARQKDLEREIAEAEAEKEAQEKRDKSRRFVHRGNLFKGKDMYAQAIPIYEEAIEIDPKYPEAYFGKGLAERAIAQKTDNKKLLQQSLEDLAKAVELNPDNTLYRNDYAYALELTGKINKAEQEYKKAIKSAEENNEKPHEIVILNLGAHYTRRNLHEKAIEQFDKYLKAVPSDLKVECWKAGQYAKLGQYTTAKEIAQDALEKGYNGAYYELGEIEYYQKHWDKAIEFFNKAIPYRPEKTDAIEFALKQIQKWRDRK